MANTTLNMAISLDGFIARKDGTVDWWTPFGNNIEKNSTFPEFKKLMDDVDAILLGRKAYDECLKTSIATGESISSWLEKRDMTCYVFTRAPRDGYERVEFVSDVIGFTKALKKRKEIEVLSGANAKGILLGGGGEISRLLLQHGLIDEIFLMIAPVILGSGLPLFGAIQDDVTCQVAGVEAYPSFTQVRYFINNRKT